MERSAGSRLFVIGDVVDGRFRVERTLAQDETTVLYGVREVTSGRAVALKTPTREHLESDKLIARFRRERALSLRFEHAHVLRVEALFETSVRGIGALVPCMLFELIEGETLAGRLAAGGALPVEEVLAIARQVAAALAASHRAGVVHRDLKPENVILGVAADGRPRAVLTDFGVARGTVAAVDDDGNDSLTATNVVLGTPAYMAPEQLELETATPATDIYAFGLMMFEMVTGRLPFSAPSTLQSVFKRVREDPPSPRRYRPSLSAAWERVILGCLTRDPADRFADGDDVASALAGDMDAGDDDDGGVSGPQGSGGGPVRRWLRSLVSQPKDQG